MTAPTNKQLNVWWEQFPYRDNPPVCCALCGRLGTMGDIQPVHPYWQETVPEYHVAMGSPFLDGRFGMCVCVTGQCANQVRHAAKARRQTYLNTLPRCAICPKRGTFKIGREYLCGRHKTIVSNAVSRQLLDSGLVGLAMFGDIGQVDMIRDEIQRLKDVNKQRK